MKISSELREKLVKEIRYAVMNMRKSETINDKMYFFSAVYGMADRVFNFEYDPELVFLHQVVRQAFDTINAKVNLIVAGSLGAGSSIPPNLFSKLQDTLDELANRIEKNQKTYSLLEDISNMGYLATGNGFYLYTKGILKI